MNPDDPKKATSSPPGGRHLLLSLLALAVALHFFVPALVAVFSRRPPDYGNHVPLTWIAGCLGVALWIGWHARSWGRALLIWAPLALALGLAGCFVPFGVQGSNSIYGKGVPLPVVIWIEGLDYPGPLSLILNPALILIGGAVLILVLRALMPALRRRDA